MRVQLAAMPWAIFNRPSIQLSSLQAYLQEQGSGIRVTTSHPYLQAAARIGIEAYRVLSERCWAGEALYHSLLFPELLEDAQRIFRQHLGARQTRSLPDFNRLIALLDAHTDEWLDSLDLAACDLFGFSVCFSQLPATLLAARRLKQRRPKLPVVLGGSTCAPAIGASLLATFPEIDFIVAGEGEIALLRLCEHLAGRAGEPGPGVLSRPGGPPPVQPDPAPQIRDLDTLPLPLFDDYFSELRHSGLTFIPTLPVEFSRGCWWNRCAFCNLNLQWRGFRQKSSNRMLREVQTLRHRYRCLDFAFTDNSLPPAEAERFFNETARQGQDLAFFGEIRALPEPQTYVRYRRGGLRTVQVGIEALADSLLAKMEKGVTVVENVAAMKYCLEAGIELDGNLILEFPGSTAEEVTETLRVLNFVLPYHPLAAATFFLGHGSPVWRDPAAFGLAGRRPHPWSRRLYPKALLDGLTLLIVAGAGRSQRQDTLWRPVRSKLKAWAEFHHQRTTPGPALSFRDGGDFLIIRQERPGQETLHHRLSGLSRQLYLACATPVPRKTLLEQCKSGTGQQLDAFLADLEAKRLLFRHNELYLALAVRAAQRSSSPSQGTNHE